MDEADETVSCFPFRSYVLHRNSSPILVSVLRTCSLFVCLNSIWVTRVLPIVNNNSHRLLFYNNGNASLVLPILVLFTGELPTVASAQVSTTLVTRLFLASHLVR